MTGRVGSSRKRAVTAARRCDARCDALEPRTLLDASLLRDLNTRPVSSSPEEIIDFNGALYMSLLGPQGRELYRSDGTRAGTTLLMDLNPGTQSSLPRDFTVAGDYLYFTAGNATGQQRNLWRTDGMAAGTVQLTGVGAAAGFSAAPGLLTPFGSSLYFAGKDPAAGNALMFTDGTPQGTKVAFDPPGTAGDVSLSALDWPGGTQVYFATGPFGGVDRAKLWETTGTPGGANAGANLLHTFAVSSVIHDWAFTTMPGGTLLFAVDAHSAGNPLGEELWTYWPIGGATPLWDVNPGPNGSFPHDFVSTRDGEYFLATGPAGDRLFKTNGVTVTQVGDFAAGKLTSAFGQTYFTRTDAGNAGIWRIGSGLFSTMERVTPFLPDGDLVFSFATLYFFATSADAPAKGLWRTDGTQAGTVLVLPFTGSASRLTAHREGVAFSGVDDVGQYPWVADAPRGTSERLGPTDDRTVGSWPFGTSAPPVAAAPVQLGDRTVFVANSTAGRLWATDGTDAGTVPLTDVNEPYVALRGARAADGRTFAYVLSQSGWVWTTDGTPAGTVRGTRVAYAPSGIQGSSSNSLATLDGNLYFAGNLTGRYPGYLTRTDGTDAGTVVLNALDTYYVTASGNAVYFTAKGDGMLGNGTDELWKTDGTPQGTVLLKHFNSPGGPVRARNLVDANGTLFFRATSADYRKEQIWKSDGTPEGTVLVKQFAGVAAGASLDVPLVATGGSVYFAAAPEDDAGNVELWKSDGTAAGTTRVRDVYPGATGSKPDSIARVGNRVYFAATDPDAGRELWATDGTEAGTARVADVAPGAAGSSPKVVGGAGGRVYFAADDATHGAELWTSDGTPDGTTLVADVAPGARASTPLFATAAGENLLFWADDGVHGHEPWVAPIPTPPPLLVGRHVFYNNSRFDGRDAGINHGDDAAIATDKEALLPGRQASFDNVTSYARGINGVMVDVNTRFASFEELRFSFKVGPGGPPSGWAAAPQPLAIVARSDHLPLDLARYEITWPDGAIKNTWLEVTVEAVTGGVTTATDVFYFGNLVGDAGSTGTTMRVDATDYSQTRARLRTTAAIDSPCDFNRDGRVDTLDLNTVRGSLFDSLPAPTTAPSATAPASAASSQARPAPAKRRTPWLASQGDLPA